MAMARSRPGLLAGAAHALQVSPDETDLVQAVLFGPGSGPHWLFEQTCRIRGMLATDEIALAQIYGLGISVSELDGAVLSHFAATAGLKGEFRSRQPPAPRGTRRRSMDAYKPGYLSHELTADILVPAMTRQVPTTRENRRSVASVVIEKFM